MIPLPYSRKTPKQGKKQRKKKAMQARAGTLKWKEHKKSTTQSVFRLIIVNKMDQRIIDNKMGEQQEQENTRGSD